MAKKPISMCWKRGGGLVPAALLSILLACTTWQTARASSLTEVLTRLAADHHFALAGTANVASFVAPPASGDLRGQLEALLRDFDHLIVTGDTGQIARVVIGHHRTDDAAAHEQEMTAAAPETHAGGASLTTSPIAGAPIASPFGPRRDPMLGSHEDHRGVDLAAPAGTPVRAPAAGVVIEADWRSGYGRYLRIRHDGTFETVYGHLDRFGDGIVPGARVAQGAVIAYVGATGRVTGAHLHYEVLAHGNAIDPARMMASQRTTGAIIASAHVAPAEAHASIASPADLEAALRHALALAYLAQRLDAIAQRLPRATPDCIAASCE
jgi:murein DD-endopeptidase MepM/ murein hydrolase activator NlpD